MATLRAGFVGLGDQGEPMAVRIARAGIPLTVWARRRAAANTCAAAGAAVAPDLAALGAASDALGVCVFSDEDVISVCEAVLPSMAAGSVLLIHSTVRPQTCQYVAARAAERGIGVLDAPVSGGGARARAARLTVMVGGDEDLLETVRPIVETYAGLIVHLGGIGSGQLAKIINNNLMAANLGLVHLAVDAGERLGLDRDSLHRVVGSSSGNSRAHELYAMGPMATTFPRGSRLLSKDVSLLARIAADEGLALAEVRAAGEVFLRALDEAVRPGS